jgi:uridine kinase
MLQFVSRSTAKSDTTNHHVSQETSTKASIAARAMAKVAEKGGTVFLTGGSGSGKSTLAHRIKEMAPYPVVILPMDPFFRQTTAERQAARDAALRLPPGKERNEAYLAVDDYRNVTDWDAFFSFMDELKRTGKAGITSCYDQTSGQKGKTLAITLPEKPPYILLLEGDTLLHPDVARYADYIIRLPVPDDVLRMRMQNRDGKKYASFPGALETRIAALIEKARRYGTRFGHRADIHFFVEETQALLQAIRPPATVAAARLLAKKTLRHAMPQKRYDYI